MSSGHRLGGGVKYNSLNSTLKIALEKGLDSEDADRRDSMNRFRLRSFCRANGKVYDKPMSVFSKWQDPEKCLN